MIRAISLTEISSTLKGQMVGPDVRFSNVSTDTRSLNPGDLYIALVGETFDGNQFVEQAFEKGACGAVVSQLVDNQRPQLLVEDTTVALGEIALLNRQQSNARVVAITGSQGKTTVKEMVGAILGVSSKVLVTRSNFNNQVGVPLTLLRLEPSHERAVIELGASGLREIAYTVRLAMPHVAVLTNAAATHIEGFGDLQGVVRTKGEIIDGLEKDGVAVLNADDENIAVWRARANGRKVVTFTVRPEHCNATYSATNITTESTAGVRFLLIAPQGTLEIYLGLPGVHNVANAVAAAAASLEAGASLADVKTGLESMRSVPGRMNVLAGPAGSVLIDDSYNASPSSFRAAIDVLATCPGVRVLIVGDMGELGPDAENAHIELGLYAKDKRIDQIWSVGGLSELTSKSFGVEATHFSDRDALTRKARDELGVGYVVLVKGSRSAQMDKVVQQLTSGELV